MNNLDLDTIPGYADPLQQTDMYLSNLAPLLQNLVLGYIAVVVGVLLLAGIASMFLQDRTPPEK